MFSSELSTLPTSDAPQDATLTDAGPSRAAPRRTYGRRREASPQEDAGGPSLAALFASFDPPKSLTEKTMPRESPSKALLNRFATSATGWMTSLDDLGADAQDGEDDLEIAKLEMARLRQEARTGKTSSRNVNLPAPITAVMPRTARTAPKLQGTSSDSTLTALPTSSLHSSPPPLAPVVAPQIEETIARPASSPAADLRDMFDESSADEEPVERSPRRSSTPASARSATPTPIAIGKTKARSRAASSRADSESPVVSARKPKLKTSRLQAFMAGLANEDETAEPTRPEAGPSRSSARASSPVADAVHDFLATLTGNDDDDDAPVAEAKAEAKETSSITVGLFDDDEDDEGADRRDSRGKKVKSLAKKDLAQMHKDVAAAKRERHYQPFKPDVERLPISAWALNAHTAIKTKEVIEPVKPHPLPALVMDSRSPVSSPMQVTPDEITAFTPSSANRPEQKVKADRRLEVVPGTSSPTPVTLTKKEDVQDEVDGLADIVGFDFAEFLTEKVDEDNRRAEIEQRRKNLALLKQAQLREQKWGAKPKAEIDSDDELSIAPKAEPTVRFADLKPTVVQRTARSVLENFKPSDSSTKSRQMVLKFAGKHAGVKEEHLTETMADFAGKTFKHANLRTSNGGARPAGQKANREHLITQKHLNDLTLAGHLKQAVSLREQKELLFKVKKRNLPPREAGKLDGLIEALVAREEAGASWESEHEDEEEEEDDDFQPSGSDDEVEGADGEDALQYSGDEGDGERVEEEEANEAEAEVPESVEADVVMDEDDQDDKENEPITVDSAAKGETPAQAVHEIPRPERSPLAEVQTAQAAATPKAMPSTFVDLAGFGSGGGSPGFSQLFEATQAAGPSTATDAFAGLRDQGEVLLPAHAMLPQVDISKTQLERDNAMIAADGDGEGETQEDRPKTQYLNEIGLLTQTKPLDRTQSGLKSSRSLLAGSSAILDGATDAELGFELSSTQKGTSEGDVLEDDSPERAGSSSRRQSLADTEGDDDGAEAEAEDEDEDEEPPLFDEPVDSRAPNAFDRLMSAGQRPLTKHQKQAKARIRSNLVDEQAEESDEDDWFVGPKTGDDEEEVEGEEDAYLPDLVDDAAVADDIRQQEDALAAAKAREMQMADDARLEADARKVVQGEHRHKRRGKDFWSEDEDGEPRGKRWTKKARRARKEWREDGLEKLAGEKNTFQTFYEQDLDSDVESVEGLPSPQAKKTITSPKRSHAEKIEMLRLVAKRNKEASARDDDQDMDLDVDLGFTRTASPDGSDDEAAQQDEESQYSISRLKRTSTTSTSESLGHGASKMRSAESYQAFVRDEATTTRRVGAIGAASVVYNKGPVPSGPGRPGLGNRPHFNRPKQSGGSSSSGGSILLTKTNKFGS